MESVAATRGSKTSQGTRSWNDQGNVCACRDGPNYSHMIAEARIKGRDLMGCVLGLNFLLPDGTRSTVAY